MNSILVPTAVGRIRTNYTGGEIQIEVASKDLENLSNGALRKLEAQDSETIKELYEKGRKCQFKALYDGGCKKVYPDQVNRFKSIKAAKERVAERRNLVRKILRQRGRKIRIVKPVTVSTSFNQYKILNVETRRISNLSFFKKVRNENKIYDESYVDEFGEYHEKIYKELGAPYTRNDGVDKTDILVLHRSGRLIALTPEGEAIQTTSGFFNLPDDEYLLSLAIQKQMESGIKYAVLLPEGGRKNKKYGEFPVPTGKKAMYHINRGNMVPISSLVKRVFIPEIDGKTRKARETISEYRGSKEGFAPVYTYEEHLHERNFVPNLLSYNQITYSDKLVILLGTKRIIKFIEGRIKDGNKITNGFHHMTKENIVQYKGQTSRCQNRRVVVKDDEVQYFGLNLKGTPEENLKNYLRSFDEVPDDNNEEVLELLEICREQDGRCSQSTIEHLLRTELKYLKSKTSSELFYLITGVEEEISAPVNKVTFLSTVEGYVEEFGRKLYKQLLSGLIRKTHKKEQALLNVLESFKSSKEIEEEEGVGLTDDLNDLEEIEKKSSDFSYKKSKNLFSQQLGILERNQNPLMMDTKVSPLSDWKMKGGPISLPTAKPLPKRDIEFVQRTSIDRVEIPLRTMFIREFYYSTKVKRTRTGEKPRLKTEVIGINILNNELLAEKQEEKDARIGRVFSSSPYPKLPDWFTNWSWPKASSAKKRDDKISFKALDKKFEECSKESKAWARKRMESRMTIPLPEPRFKARITDFPVELPKKMGKVIKQEVTYPGLSETMFPRKALVPRFAKQIIIKPCLKGAMFPRTIFFKRYLKQYEEVSNKERFLLRNKRPSQFERYLSKGAISTVRLFDNKTKPGEVLKKVSWKQFKASEQKPYQFSGKLVFDEKKHEFVRITPPNNSSSFKILHTIGDGKGGIDYYIIEVNGTKLYARGDLSLLDKELVSFTGTRTPTKETQAFVKATVTKFLEDDKECVTVSGGAKGCDTIVHSITMSLGRKTIVVLAGGINYPSGKKQVSPEEVVKSGGLILSEHEPSYSPEPKDFVLRNRIIAGLSERLVVFEAKRGTMHCADFGVQMGKELLVQPGTERSTELITKKGGVPFFPIEGYYPF